MATIRIENLSHSYDGKTVVLRPMNFTFEQGRSYALLGPSGCGKTTLLNILSGLLRPSSGRIFIDDREVTTLDPAQRNLAQVFQFPVVYDSMTVGQNLHFPLKRRGTKPGEAHQRIRTVAKLLELESLLDQRAVQLSGHIKQLISLGRALVRQDVSAILLDEPLTMIDLQKKLFIRRKIIESRQAFPSTMILVTHDQTEAMGFADEILVMNQGEIQQAGSPEEIFDNPKTPFVGRFVGSPGMNFFPARWEDGSLRLRGGSGRWRPESPAGQSSGEVLLGIRAHHLRVGRPGSETDDGFVLEEPIADIGWHNSGRVIRVERGDESIRVNVPFGHDQQVGEKVRLHIPFRDLKIFHQAPDKADAQMWN